MAAGSWLFTPVSPVLKPVVILPQTLLSALWAAATFLCVGLWSYVQGALRLQGRKRGVPPEKRPREEWRGAVVSWKLSDLGQKHGEELSVSRGHCRQRAPGSNGGDGAADTGQGSTVRYCVFL